MLPLDGGGEVVQVQIHHARLGGRRRDRWAVDALRAEHREQDVAAASGQADQGGVVAFAFAAFAVVLGA
jgi:hypothetical protein